MIWKYSGNGFDNGYTFELPDPPPLSKIDGYRKAIKDQVANAYNENGAFCWKWAYTLTDQQFDDLSSEEQREIIDREAERCANGYWFFLEGKLFYLTPDNYFFLTFWKIDGEPPLFVKEQAYNFYFYEFVENDTKCFGSLELKPRREGCTQRKLAMYCNYARIAKRKKLGILSKTAADAQEVNFFNLIAGFIDLPEWMKPEVAGQFPPKTTLEFAKPSKRLSDKNQKTGKNSSSTELRTIINWKATTGKAYDGQKLHRLIMDECGKWSGTNIYTSWMTHKKCLETGYKIIGKAFLLSTIEGDDDKDSDAAAIANFVEIWKNSDYNKRDSMGRTVTGLYRWFIPGWLSKLIKDDGSSLVDEFGNHDSVKAKMLVEVEIASALTPEAKQQIRRQNPFTPQDALQAMSSTNTFRNPAILSRLRYLQEYQDQPREVLKARPLKYRRGNLHWINNERLTKVRFVDHVDGKYCIAYFPDIAGYDKRNAVKILENGFLAPFGTTQFVLGADVFHFDDVRGEGSMGAFHVKLKYNFQNPQLCNIYCLEYLYREASTEQLYEEMTKAAFFYGAKMQVERSAEGFFKWAKRNKVSSFVMNRPEAAKWSSYTKQDDGLGTPTSKQLIKIGCEFIENYFSPPNAEKNENEKDNLEYFWFDRTLEQVTQFDIANTTEFDAVMAMIHTEVGAQSIKQVNKEIPTVNNDPSRKSAIDYLFPITQNGTAVTHGQYRQQKKLAFR